MTSDDSPLDVVPMGKGRNLVLLHSLLSDRTAFDRIAPQGQGAFHIMAEKVEDGGMEAVLATALQRMFPDDFLVAHPAIAEERKVSLRAAGRECFAAACRALARFDRRAGLGAIRNPTLVVVGLRDTATPPGLSYELAAGIAGAALIELAQCGHSPHIQAPEGFWQAIKSFLQLAG
jgi:3-oxoadipate enol-lactonase